MLRKLSLALMMGGILAVSNAFALGIGDITVKSALNQRLDAEIELLSSVEGELDDLTVKLASQEAFDRIGLERPSLLTGIRFEVTTRTDGTPIVKLSTTDNVREPFLDFLVEINWPKGRMLREYTVLLEPSAAIAIQQPAPGSTPEPPVPTAPYISDAEPAPLESTDPATVSPGTVSPGTVSPGTVSPGEVETSAVPYDSDTYGPIADRETLWSIAALIKSGGVTTQQMVLALFENNSEAFIGGDIHLIKKGAMLRIPGAEIVSLRSRIDAVAEMRRYNARLGITPEISRGSGVPEAMPAVSEGTGVPEAMPAVSEGTGVPEAMPAVASTPPGGTAQRDELSLLTPDNASSAGTGSASDDIAALKRELALATETMSSQRLENDELQSRVHELEATVEEMDKLRRLLEIQNEEMAKLQRQIVAGDDAGSALAAPREAEAVPVQAPAADTVATTADAPSLATAESAATAEAAPVTPEPVEAPPLTPPAKKEPVDLVMDYVNRITGDPMLLAVAGGVLLVLFALVGLIRRRKKAVVADDPVFAQVTEQTEQTETGAAKQSIFAGLAASFAGFKDKIQSLRKSKSEDLDLEDEDISPGSEGVTSGHALPKGDNVAPVDELSGGDQPSLNDMMFEEDDAGSSPDNFSAAAVTDTEEPALEPPPDEPDSFEEVDIYEAFGDFEQAAEIVKQVIADQPGNNRFKLRLFKVYQSGNMSDDYSRDAAAYKSEMQGSPEWEEIKMMGREFVPDCPAWGEGGVGAASMDKPAAPAEEPAEVAAAAESPEIETADIAMDPAASDLDLAGEKTQTDISAEQKPSDDNEAGHTLEFSLTDLSFDSADGQSGEAENEPEPAGNELEFDLEGIVPDAPEGADVSEESGDSSAGMDMEPESDSPPTSEQDPGEPFESTVQINANAAELEVLRAENAASEDSAAVLADKDEDSAESDFSIGVDLSDFSFDLEESGASEALQALEDTESDEAGNAPEEDDKPDKVAIKLDLARAYIDMGDADGAKGILDEVLSEGSEAQQQQAQKLMNNI